MNAETISTIVAECGDLMLAKDCVAALRKARFRGSIQLKLPGQIEELELRHFFGFGSPIGEATARGALVGGIVGLAIAAIASKLPLSAGLTELGSLVIVTSVATISGGLISFVRARGSLAQRLNSRGLMLCCRGDSAEIAKAVDALRDAPCRDLRIAADMADEASTAAA